MGSILCFFYQSKYYRSSHILHSGPQPLFSHLLVPSAQFRPLLSGWRKKKNKTRKILSASARLYATLQRSLSCVRPTCNGLSDSTGICRRPTTRAETMPCPKTPTTSPRRRGSQRGRPLPEYAPTTRAYSRDSPSASGANTTQRWCVGRALESRCCVTVLVTSLMARAVAKAAAQWSCAPYFVFFSKKNKNEVIKKKHLSWTHLLTRVGIKNSLLVNCSNFFRNSYW